MKIGGWKGKVRLLYGARSPLEMLYMNDENNDLANYFDQPTFKAFQAVSPRPHFDEPVALDKALEQNAAEVWEMARRPSTRVFVAGTKNLLDPVEKAMARLAGSAEQWTATRAELVSRDGEVGRKCLDLRRAHLARMPLAVEENKALNPMDILRFGADAVMLDAYPLADLVQQLGRICGVRCVVLGHGDK